MIKAYKVCWKALSKVYDPEKHDLYILHCNEEYRAKERYQREKMYAEIEAEREIKKALENRK